MSNYLFDIVAHSCHDGFRPADKADEEKRKMTKQLYIAMITELSDGGQISRATGRTEEEALKKALALSAVNCPRRIQVDLETYAGFELVHVQECVKGPYFISRESVKAAEVARDIETTRASRKVVA